VSNISHVAIPLLAICLPLSAAYPIRLGRPDKVGSVLMVQAKGMESTKGKTRVGGQLVPFPETSTTIALNFRWEVLEANELRKATKLKLTLGTQTPGGGLLGLYELLPLHRWDHQRAMERLGAAFSGVIGALVSSF
jgi:hypothetical protein